MQYVLNPDHSVEEMTDPVEWLRRYELDDRLVASETIGKSTVVTQFTGIAQGDDSEGRPLLFETMVMKGRLDGTVRRYASYKAAEKGHKEVLVMVTAAEGL